MPRTPRRVTEVVQPGGSMTRCRLVSVGPRLRFARAQVPNLPMNRQTAQEFECENIRIPRGCQNAV